MRSWAAFKHGRVTSGSDGRMAGRPPCRWAKSPRRRTAFSVVPSRLAAILRPLLQPGTGMPDFFYDVVCIGNAIVDVLAHADDAAIERLKLNRNTMTLVDAARSEEIYQGMGPGVE